MNEEEKKQVIHIINSVILKLRQTCPIDRLIMFLQAIVIFEIFKMCKDEEEVKRYIIELIKESVEQYKQFKEEINHD